MTAEAISRNAARIAVSGPAAGAMAGAFFARQCGFDNAISLDMGGTSADISLMYAGEVRVANEWSVEFGYPIMFPSIEIVTIGAGGGSIAWIDQGGSLRNGPQSMGADPGTGGLPARRQRGNQHRRQSRPRPPQPGRAPGRRDAARSRRRRTSSDKESRPAPRLRRRAGRGRHHPGRQRQHGRRRPPDLHPSRLRSPRFLPRRLRRRRLGPRRPSGARARHSGGRRPALPGITSALGCLLLDVRTISSAPTSRRPTRQQRRAGDRVRQAGG